MIMTDFLIALFLAISSFLCSCDKESNSISNSTNQSTAKFDCDSMKIARANNLLPIIQSDSIRKIVENRSFYRKFKLLPQDAKEHYTEYIEYQNISIMKNTYQLSEYTICIVDTICTKSGRDSHYIGNGGLFLNHEKFKVCVFPTKEFPALEEFDYSLDPDNFDWYHSNRYKNLLLIKTSGSNWTGSINKFSYYILFDTDRKLVYKYVTYWDMIIPN